MKIPIFTLSFFISVTASLSVASAPPPIPVVTTEKAKLSNLSDSLTYPARVESRVNSVIYSESDGVVTHIIRPLAPM